LNLEASYADLVKQFRVHAPLYQAQNAEVAEVFDRAMRRMTSMQNRVLGRQALSLIDFAAIVDAREYAAKSAFDALRASTDMLVMLGFDNLASLLVDALCSPLEDIEFTVCIGMRFARDYVALATQTTPGHAMEQMRMRGYAPDLFAAFAEEDFAIRKIG
jgi:hypothetical protein